MAEAIVNDREDVNDDVRSAIAALKGDEPPVADAASTPPAETEGLTDALPDELAQADGKSDRARGPDGKFVPKEAAPVSKDAAPAKAAAPDPKSPPPEDTTKASAPQPSTAAVAPPVSWAADAKAAWATLSPAIQTAVLKREQEASNGFAQYSDKVKAYENVLAPLNQEVQRRGMTLSDGIQRLLDGERFLATQPAQAILWLAQKHGLNLTELATNPPAPQAAQVEQRVPQSDPRVSQLEERLNSILMDQNMGVVQSFAASNPLYEKVEAQLPSIMTQLKAVNPSLTGASLLHAAYDQAVWLTPDARDQLIAERMQQSKIDPVRAKAVQASRAAVSVKGSSSVAAPPAKKESKGDVYDAVRDAIAQHRAN